LQISSPLSPSRRSDAPEKIAAGLGYPVLFHWIVLAALAALLVVAAGSGLTPLRAGTACWLAWALVARLGSRAALRRITASVKLDRDRAFPGEAVNLEMEIANRGLPLPWLEAEMELPVRLMTGKKPDSPYTWRRPRWVTALARGQTVAWKHTIEAGARGEYRLGPLRLRSGDMFGIYPKELVLPEFATLLVYPRLFPIEKLGLPQRALYGEKVTARSIYEDTSRVAGVRDYRHSDPFKRIHWKASAAHGRLQTRQYESSTSLSLTVLLDAAGYGEGDEFERAVSTAASLVFAAQRQGFSVGLAINSDLEVRLPMGSGPDHLMRVLEALARVNAGGDTPVFACLDSVRAVLPAGATLVVITHAAAATFSGLTGPLEREGHSLLCLSTAAEAGGGPV